MARPTLVCLLPARNCEQDLPGYFESVARFAEAVVALDDGSSDHTRDLLEAQPLVSRLLVNPPREDYRGWDDSQNRNRLLQAAAELDPVWILSLDADERIDPGDAAALRDFLERDALPGLAYGFKVHRMVEDLGRYDRADLWVYRLFACEPGQRFPIQRLHFVPVPTSIPRARWLPTTIRIQHVGSLTEERRRARVDKYRQADAENAFQPDYANLLAPPREVKSWQPRPAELPVLATPTATGRLALFRPESIDPDAPAISAVVIAQNDEGEIERSVRSVVEQECPEPFEVIVVTSGTDRTAALVREKFPHVTLVELPKPVLPGEARNVGLRVAGGDYASFPGSHVELPQGSLAARLEAHDLGYAMVTGTMLNGTRTWAGWASYFLDHSTVLPGRPSGPLQGPPAHCSYVRDLLLQVGGFPEDMRAGEDTVVNWELTKRGYTAYRSQEVRLVHHSPCRGLLRLLRHHFVRGRALGRILLGPDGGPGRRRRWPILRSLLLRYIPRRVSVTSENVKRWGRDLRRTYRLAYPLVVAGAVAASAGACYEVLRPARRMADVREPRLEGQQTPAGEAAPAGKR